MIFGVKRVNEHYVEPWAWTRQLHRTTLILQLSKRREKLSGRDSFAGNIQVGLELNSSYTRELWNCLSTAKLTEVTIKRECVRDT
jgi:hypothetical protein